MTDAKTFSDVKSRLSEAISSDRDTVTISRSDAERIEKSWFPRDDKLPTGHCCFDASLVPFLAAAIDHDCYRYFDIGGISIMPHPNGGVYISASNGTALCIAHDPDGTVSNGGMRLMLPKNVINMCKPRSPIEFESCGEIYQQGLPDWCQPGLIRVVDGVIMIFPSEAPPDLDLGKDETPLIWSRYAETNNAFNSEDFRIGKPLEILGVISEFFKDKEGDTYFPLGAPVLAKVTDAIHASGVEFWNMHPRKNMTAFFPTMPEAAPLGIFLAHGNRFYFQLSGADFPKWISGLTAFESTKERKTEND